MRTLNGRAKNLGSLVGTDARNCGETEGNVRTGEFNQIREGAFNRVNIDLSRFGGVCPAGKGGFVKKSLPYRLHPGK